MDNSTPIIIGRQEIMITAHLKNFKKRRLIAEQVLMACLHQSGAFL